ncbi:MAG: hypothetical protein MUC59_00340 [Saprospiraceae bacterium]|jgi:hypothetical protein|nr:hypothetical protein [Saprospiraceae bacterium]
MKTACSIAVLFLLALPSKAQQYYLTGISSYFDDSFVEWRFYAEDEDGNEEEGTLKLTWQLREDDWTEWDYRIGDLTGNIKMKWKDKPEEWDLRGNNTIINARSVWPGQFDEWRITDNTTTLTLKSKWGNQSDEWLLRSSNNGNFNMFTSYERDPRDWVIEDELDDKVSFEMKLMLMFVVMFNSTPKQ